MWIILFSIVFGLMVLLFAQHGKNRLKLEPNEVDKLNDTIDNKQATDKDKNKAKQKLKAHEKSERERKSRQSKEDKKQKKK